MTTPGTPRTEHFEREAQRFRDEAHAIVDVLADHFASMARDETNAIRTTEPEAIAREMRTFAASRPRVRDVAARMIEHLTNTQSPRFLGHQVSAPSVEGALGLMMGALVNNSAGVFEMGPWAAAMERVVVEWALGRVGYTKGDGILTSGGSVGNLTALLAARQRAVPGDVWREGVGHRQLAILTSTESHYSVGRAARILGLGDEGVVPVAVDARRRLDPSRLEDALDDAKRRGRYPFALVVSAASTATGAFDPIDPSADFAERHGLWLHVDGAHGAAALVSPTHASLVRGIDRADSVVWDAHKMLSVPSLATFLLYKDRAASFAAFTQNASYLFDDYRGELPWHDGALRTLECTKPALGLPLFTLLATRGESHLSSLVERTFALGPTFAAILRSTPDFEVAIDPEINIVCFRWIPEGLERRRWSDVQRQVRKALLEDGRFYIVQTALGDDTWLRTTLINPETCEADLRALLDRIRTLGARIIAAS